MKLLFVLRNIVVHAGIERVMVDKMNYLAENGHDVTLVTYEQGQHPIVFTLHPLVKHVDIKCCMFPLYRLRLPFRILKMWQMVKVFKRLFSRFVTEVCPDLIITVSNAEDYMYQIMTAPNGKKVVEVHSSFPTIMLGKTLRAKVKAKVLLRAIKKCDMLISLTCADAEYWKSYVSKVRNVPNPVAFFIDNPDVSLRLDGRILCVSRLHEQKRIDRLIDAFSLIAQKYPSWYIDIYGDGEEKVKLETQIEKNNLVGRINLLEPTPHIIDEYQKSNFLVLSSDYEGMPLVLLEAMACGVPCVSTCCPFGPSELIENGINGLLTNLDSKDFAAKMEWMITHEEERIQMGIKAHESAAKYKKDVIMKKWEETYKIACM